MHNVDAMSFEDLVVGIATRSKQGGTTELASKEVQRRMKEVLVGEN